MPQSFQSTDLFSEYAQNLIQMRARQLVRRPEFSKSDLDDIQQDLLLHLLNQAEQFDPARASVNTFIARVVDSGVAMLIRESNRDKRSPAEGVAIQSIAEMVPQPDGPPAPLANALLPSDADRRTGAETKSQVELADTAEGVAHLIATLPPDLQEVCRARMEMGRAKTLRTLGLSRRGYNAAMKQIRARFEESELWDFSIFARRSAKKRHK